MEILLVEDDDVDARLVGRLLGEASDFPFTLQRSTLVADASERLKNGSFAAVLLDLGLPDGIGLQTLESIKPFANGTAVIVLTGDQSGELISQAFVAGAHDYLVKGNINSDNLVRSLRYSVERRQAETKIRRSAAQYKSLVENLPQLIARKDREGRYTYANQSFLDFHGLELDQLIGKSTHDVFSAEAAAQYAAEDRRVLAEGQTFRDVQACRNRAGEIRRLSILKLPIREAPGQAPTGIQCVHEDITERLSAESKIREQAKLLNMTHEAIIGCDLRGRIHFWNRGAELLYGAGREAMLGKFLRDFPGPSGRQADDAFTKLQHAGEWAGELEQTTRKGKVIYVDSRWTLVPGEEGQADSVVVINSDITRRKTLERESLRAQRLDSLGTLAGGIAHDLNNVLSPIMTGLSLVRYQSDPQDFEEIVEMMQESVDRGARIVNQILSFARGTDEEKSEVDLHHLVDRLFQLIRATFPPGIKVHLNLPDKLWNVMGDETQLEQAVMNLMVNARDAMPHGGGITLRAVNHDVTDVEAGRHYGVVPGPYVRLSVQDDGCGIPEDILDKIFDPFFTTKEVGKGTGLGLSTVAGIIKNHRGFMTVESQESRGTTFVLHFPAAQRNREARNFEVGVDVPRGKGETILLVDDESRIRELMKRTLEKNGYRVLEASNGADAVAALSVATRQVDLMIVDLVMPVMDGVATFLAARHLRPQLPVLVVSGSVGQDSRGPGGPLKGVPWLRKPCATPLLLATIRKLLEPPEHSPNHRSGAAVVQP